jgi:hypothetical protein
MLINYGRHIFRQQVLGDRSGVDWNFIEKEAGEREALSDRQVTVQVHQVSEKK